MNSLHQQDLVEFNKSKRKVILHLILSFCILCLFYAGLFFLYTLDFLKDSNINLIPLILGMAIGEIGFYGLLFIGLGTGNKVFRILYWICFIASTSLLYFPIQYLMDDIKHMIPYIVFLVCLIIKTIYLFKQGLYYHKNKYAKVYFDYILEVEEDEPVIQNQPITPPVNEEYYEIEEYEQEYTYPQISIRLGICVYASLIVFPIFVQIFSNFFSSTDMKSVFATKDIFILCIFTAFIWTIPVFYLYYDHPYSKRIVFGCILTEIVGIILYSIKFYGYMTNPATTYPIRVFILFIVIDLIRYILIYFSIRILFKNNSEEKASE